MAHHRTLGDRYERYEREMDRRRDEGYDARDPAREFRFIMQNVKEDIRAS